MPTNIPVVPIALGALIAAIASGARRLKALARARRHRHEAGALAGLDQHMLRDIGISQADLRDAFSSPFWEDPTALLHERVEERRKYRSVNLVVLPRRPRGADRKPDAGFRRPRTDRPARHAV